MKSFVFSAVAALALAAPIHSSAQQADHALSRAEVKAELARLAAVGYHPTLAQTPYPDDVQSALQRVNAQPAAQSGAAEAPEPAATDFGSDARAATESGRPAIPDSRNALYRGH
ncbi:DUF4148 domain-containing protein [Burkholderia multivorans]|uniref:DUF4148 domain-containing protein n=1 Tax=Burkholderia ubonensis TaxID=101571 RepID=UPI000F6D6DF6|nr:DUF4148 domain-containing protein [Burkholderia ubonensis]AYZ68186.1 DUF4148 domain-containing protein [Burkholderia multivorans]VWB21748.1 membrane protein [Burkholderia ubonensis]